MKKVKPVLFTPEERSKQLEPILREVKKQVKQYHMAKKADTLRKAPGQEYLFNI